MSKLIFFDVDDTLVHHRGDKSYIPKSTLETIGALRNNGHKVAIASGRGFSQMNHIMDYLDIQTAVAYNGHELLDNGKVVYKNPLEKKETKRLIKELSKSIKPFIVATSDRIYIKDFLNFVKNKFVREIKPIEDIKGVDFVENIRKFDYKRDIEKEIYNIMIINSKFHSFDKYPGFDFKDWGGKVFEVSNKGVNKLTGIKKMAQILSYDMDDVIVFGDNYNDIEMLEGISHSVAMGNAVSEAKKVASFVTRHIEDDGVYHACKHYELI